MSENPTLTTPKLDEAPMHCWGIERTGMYRCQKRASYNMNLRRLSSKVRSFLFCFAGRTYTFTGGKGAGAAPTRDGKHRRLRDGYYEIQPLKRLALSQERRNQTSISAIFRGSETKKTVATLSINRLRTSLEMIQS